MAGKKTPWDKFQEHSIDRIKHLKILGFDDHAEGVKKVLDSVRYGRLQKSNLSEFDKEVLPLATNAVNMIGPLVSPKVREGIVEAFEQMKENYQQRKALLDNQIKKNSIPGHIQKAARAIGQMVQRLKPSGRNTRQNNNSKGRTR